MNGTTGLGGGTVGDDPGPSWHVKSSGDFNGDGKSDILWQNNSGTASVWLMNGTTYAGGGDVIAGGGDVVPLGGHIIGTDGLHFIYPSSSVLNATLLEDVFDFDNISVSGDRNPNASYTISGFDVAHDHIALRNSVFPDFTTVQAHLTASSGGTQLRFGDFGQSLFIQGVAPDSLTSSNFFLTSAR